MGHRAFRTGFAGALLAGSALVSSCGYAKSCDVRFPPQEQPEVERGRIIARIYAICDKPPEAHHLTYWVEKRNTNGEFTPASAPVSSDRIPGRRKTSYDPIELPCRPGVYRTAAQITGAMDGKPYEFTTNSGNRTVFASDC